MAFSDTLRDLLDDRDMRAADLSRATGLSEAAISDYLKGKKEPRGKQSAIIAKALLVSLDTLWETDFAPEITKKSPTPSNDDAEDKIIQLFYEFLVKSGCIKNGDDLTLLQAETVAAMIRVIRAAFSVEEQHFIG